jgi:predicted nucleic-acid-binding Zn-ribbon protein
LTITGEWRIPAGVVSSGSHLLQGARALDLFGFHNGKYLAESLHKCNYTEPEVLYKGMSSEKHFSPLERHAYTPKTCPNSKTT